MIDLTEAKGLTEELLNMVINLNIRIAHACDQGMFVNLAITERETVLEGSAKGRCPRINIGVACDPREIDP